MPSLSSWNIKWNSCSTLKTTLGVCVSVGQVNYPKVADNSSFDEDSSDALSPEQPASHESQGSVPSPMDSRICEPLPSTTGTSLAQVRMWWPPAVPWSFTATADFWQTILKTETKGALKGIVCEISQGVLALCGIGAVLWLFRSPCIGAMWGRGTIITWWYSLRWCETDSVRQHGEIQVWDFDSFSALRSCAASQGQLKQWVKGV